MSDIAYKNTDHLLWRAKSGDFYSDSVHVTEGGGIGINVGGTVIVRTPSEWHRLVRELAAMRRERDAAIADKDSIFESFTKMSATNEQTFQNWRKSVARAEQLRLHMFGHTAECNECRRLLGIDRAAQQRQTKKSIVDYIHERWGPVMQRLADGDDKPTDQ